MSHPKHFAILKQAVKTWNEWREANPDTPPNLKRVNLDGADLQGANVQGANLQNANLRGAILCHAEHDGRRSVRRGYASRRHV